jgi:hypothetical protein
MVVSAVFSAESAAVNLSLMRRGLMLTDDGAASLASDLRLLPETVGDWARAARGGVRRALQKQT